MRILSSSSWSLHYYEEGEELEESDDGSEDLALSKHTSLGILLGKVWPHLTKLISSEGCVKAGDLMSIVGAHRGSLRDLSLNGISLLGEEGWEPWEHFGKEMGQILRLHSFCCSYCVGDPGRALVRDMMQWAPPDLLEIEEERCTIAGRLKAGSS